MVKTYVFMFGIADIVAGGPIYDCNKIRYLKEIGWTVNVLPTNSGNIFIEPLKEYSNQSFSFIETSPFVFSKEELEEKLTLLASNVNVSEEIVIETGTDYTALWGELLAKKLNAKHIIIFLDEKNSNVNKHTAKFYKFKYDRNELASISMKSLKHIFENYFELPNPDRHVLSAICSNTVANIESDIIKKIPKGDYVIGSIGRLDKPFVSEIIEGICDFANEFKDKKISVCLFGGADEAVICNIKNKLQSVSNIEYYISGYIWPIPKEVFENVDIFISAAGSARASANQNVPTIRMSVIDYQPEGILYNLDTWESIVLNKNSPSVCDYLRAVLIDGMKVSIQGTIPIDEEWKWVKSNFDKHIQFYENSCKNKEYYPTNKIWNGHKKSLIKKIILLFINSEKFSSLKKLSRIGEMLNFGKNNR